MTSLKKWSMEKFGAVNKELESIRRRLEELAEQNSEGQQKEMSRMRICMDELLYREEMMWLQCSQISWLKEGDRNTKYFHCKAASRAKKNRIKLLRKEDGQIMKDKKEMANMTRDFFKKLYNVYPGVQPEELVNLFQPLIMEDMNKELCKDFAEEEISDALFQIGPLKAPGPDDFPAGFFQRNWAVIKLDVIRGVKRFFETGNMPPGVNETAIVFITEKDNPELLKEFWSISLCNVIYKVVSKCLVNILRPLLQDLIAPMQSAFIPRRMISDNILIAF
jgi:hypothetical protein